MALVIWRFGNLAMWLSGGVVQGLKSEVRGPKSRGGEEE